MWVLSEFQLRNYVLPPLTVIFVLCTSFTEKQYSHWCAVYGITSMQNSREASGV